jgi:hypothetical protein
MVKKKLTEADVIGIRNSTAQGHVLAKKFGVHRFTILQVRQGLTYRHVSPPVGRPWVTYTQKNASPEMGEEPGGRRRPGVLV